MTDHKTTDAELDTYLNGKSSLSELYQQSEPGGPGKKIDDAILNAARQEVQKHNSGSAKRGFRWYVPMALAASLIVAVAIIRIVPVNHTSEPDQLAIDKEQVIPGQHVGSGKATPEIILKKIDGLVANNEMSQAQQEYELFIELFPQHEVDFKKYPNVKKLSKK